MFIMLYRSAGISTLFKGQVIKIMATHLVDLYSLIGLSFRLLYKVPTSKVLTEFPLILISDLYLLTIINASIYINWMSAINYICYMLICHFVPSILDICLFLNPLQWHVRKREISVCKKNDAYLGGKNSLLTGIYLPCRNPFSGFAKFLFFLIPVTMNNWCWNFCRFRIKWIWKDWTIPRCENDNIFNCLFQLFIFHFICITFSRCWTLKY